MGQLYALIMHHLRRRQCDEDIRFRSLDATTMHLVLLLLNVFAMLPAKGYYDYDYPRRRYYDDVITRSYNEYKDQRYIYPKAQYVRNAYYDEDVGDEIKFHEEPVRPKFKTANVKPRRDSTAKDFNDVFKFYFKKYYNELNHTDKEELEENALFLEDIETLDDPINKSKLLAPSKLWHIKNSTQLLAKKFLSLFTIIKFPNTLCTGNNGVNTYEGTCYYETECQTRNGTVMGVCADGYGVCCVFVRSCGSTSGQNCTYFESPNYPNYYPSNGTIIPPTVSPVPNATIDPRLRYQLMMFLARQESAGNSLLCEFQVTKASNTVRQLRVDFIDLELRGPTNGTCIMERLLVTGQNRNSIVPVICGYNSGQHMYIDVTDVVGPVKFSIISTAVERKRFRIKVCQITECNNPLNCLQYFTGPSGVISSFNYDQASSLSRSTPEYFNNLNYAMCIRKEAGYCSVTYTNTINGTAYQFQLVNYDETGISTVPPGQAGAEIFSCPDDYLVINGIRLCGERLNDGSDTTDFTRNAPVTDTGSGPIVIPFRTDKDRTGRGFRLFYMQNLC